VLRQRRHPPNDPGLTRAPASRWSLPRHIEAVGGKIGSDAGHHGRTVEVKTPVVRPQFLSYDLLETGQMFRRGPLVDHGLVSELQSKGLPGQVDDTVKEAKKAVANLDTASVQVRQAITDLNRLSEIPTSVLAKKKDRFDFLNTPIERCCSAHVG